MSNIVSSPRTTSHSALQDLTITSPSLVHFTASAKIDCELIRIFVFHFADHSSHLTWLHLWLNLRDRYSLLSAIHHFPTSSELLATLSLRLRSHLQPIYLHCQLWRALALDFYSPDPTYHRPDLSTILQTTVLRTHWLSTVTLIHLPRNESQRQSGCPKHSRRRTSQPKTLQTRACTSSSTATCTTSRSS